MGGAQGRRNGQHESLQRNQVNLSFALCLEKNTNERFRVGFRNYQRPGVAPTPSNVAELFIDGFAETEDCE